MVVLDAGVRMRHMHKTMGGEVVEFVLQLEVEGGRDWKPVVRYDSAHGESHRHFFGSAGQDRRESLDLDFADALTFAEADLRGNWERYATESSK